ncbi:Copper amine oxidase N-terminal domain-containing protein [Desulfotomaculum arcticum]|uniref:Copper amine oxidase N-terminal domain-containing protein n=1 Tax=Desulfotruncus arcticus DSM 17038 TaxID=1121424 RepID=A0A1I2Z982_9FIRM|nr:copper amine oxidase N-terminal domain-containing protein [Desulfotruncus arcticus]SFH34099.1 Copper amine oxidase N-terminal domain-containing protein [Desulfotomaculum arcticum] [Desulfotruncus arcticus DSM 17038]
MKRFALFFGLILVLAMLVINLPFITGANAQEQEQVNVYEDNQLVKSVVFVVGNDHYFVNNETPGVKMDAKPFIETGRTFVPIRYLSNALGVTDKYIGWESPKVTLDEPDFPVVELTVGSKTIKSDGKATTMDVTPLLRQGRTYLPARFVAEALGYQVEWLPENNIVLCWPKGTKKPDVSSVIEYIGRKLIPQEPVEVQQPVEEQPQANPEIPAGETRTFSGKPLDPNDYVVAERKAIPYEFKQPGASIMEMTVEELRQEPVAMGSNNDTIIYDVDVQKDMFYVKQASSGLIPARLILAKGNDVSVQRDNTLKEYSSNPFTHGYYVSLEADPGGGTKIEDVTHIMLLFSNQALAIKNPLYKGGSK